MKLKLSALTLIATIGTAALFACAPQPQPRNELAFLATANTAAACQAGDFLKKVHYLQKTSPPFVLPAVGFDKVPPADFTQINAVVARDLTGAFKIAPHFFRQQLCDLTGIFIDANNCAAPYDPAKCGNVPDAAIIGGSWGYRAFDAKYNDLGEYIGISLALWNGGKAPTFAAYDTRRLKVLLSELSRGSSSGWPNPPTYTSGSSSNDTSAMTVLAILAHEIGHVLWYDAFVPQPGGSIQRSNFCDSFYTPNSWGLPVDIPPGRWLDFGETNDNIKHYPDYITPLSNDLTRDPGHPVPNFDQAAKDLVALLQDPGLAGTLAAVSPQEDFVETYVLDVLLRSKDSTGKPQFTDFSLGFGIGGSAVYNIPKFYKVKYDLLTKMSCFGHLPG